MSNFGVTYLLKVYKGANRLSIEDNIGEEIHIHFGPMRLMLKNDAFCKLADNAIRLIADASGVSVDVLNKLDPIFLFDLCRRGELPSLVLKNEEYIEVGRLLCPVRNRFGISRYKTIEHSHFMEIIKGKTKISPFDQWQANYFSKSNYTRCQDVLELCKANANICEEHPLFVTEENHIRDGQHRAAALYYLYGKDFKVKIQRMSTIRPSESNRSNLVTFMVWIRRRLKEFLLSILHSGKKRERKMASKEYYDAISKPLNKDAFNELRKNDNKPFFCVDENVSISQFPVLIKRNGIDLSSVKAYLQSNGYQLIQGHQIEGISFIYGLKEDWLVVDKQNNPVAYLQDKISSYAMSVNSFMPYAPEIQRYLNQFKDMPETLVFTLRLLKCMFDKKNKGFFEEDVSYFSNHSELLDSEFFSKEGLFEKVFFGYTDRLIQLLQNGDYQVINDDYKRFRY